MGAERATGDHAIMRACGFDWEIDTEDDGYFVEVKLADGSRRTGIHETRDEAIRAAAEVVRPGLSATTWGDWFLDKHTECLVLDGYQVSLIEMCTASGVLGWLYHLKGKSWITPTDLSTFLEAIDDIMTPRQSFKSGAVIPAEELTRWVSLF